MKKSYIIIILGSFLVLLSMSGMVSAANYTVNPGDSIQTTVNSASNDDTILVKANNGTVHTYNENVIINKRLNLKSADGVTVKALNSSKPIFTINNGGSGSHINGFNITGATNSSGVYLDSVNNCVIGNNIIKNNAYGVYLIESLDNTIQNNNITNNTMGIFIEDHYYTPDNPNNILSNVITGNNQSIHLNTTTANIHFNQIASNTIGLYINGEYANINWGMFINSDNNWWGSNNPKSKNLYDFNGTSDILYYGYIDGPFYDEEIIRSYKPWLVLNVIAQPETTGNSSTVIVDLTRNNYGQDTSSQGHIPDNIPVNFITNIGTVISPVYTWNGKATSTFNRGTATSGVANITITLNNQAIQTNIIIDTTPPTVIATPIGGAYFTTQSVTLTATDNLDPNPTIYYTLDGSTPTTSTIRYTGPISIANSVFLSFMAVDTAGNTGSVQTLNYVIAPIININTNKGYSHIQNAIDDSSTQNGHTIAVSAGTYIENVVINKNLTLRSVTGNVTVQALNPSKPVFTINSSGSGSHISGFRINGAIRGIFLNSADNCTITSNNITNNSRGIILNSDNCTINSNNITNNGYGISFISSSNNNLVSQNRISSNEIGIYFEGSNNNQVLENTITNNSYGLYFFESINNEIHFNQISGNQYGIYSELGLAINYAQNNWWGSNNPSISPNTPSDICIKDGTVIYNPWLVLNVNTQPTSTNSTSTITADLTHNNNGENTSSQGHIPDNIPVNFTTNLGAINSPIYTRNGKATSIFNRGTATSGVANITTTLDNQTIQNNVTIDTTPPTVTTSLPGGVYNTTKSVTLTATDNIDSNPVIYYSTNNGTTWNNRVKTVTLNLSQGITNLKYYAHDMAGNTSPTQTINYTIDTNPPTVTINIPGGVYNTIKSVTLTAIDNLDPNPVIYYSVDNGTTWNNRVKTVTLNLSQGITNLKYYTRDAAANNSTIQTATYTIDTTPPTVNSTDPADDAVEVPGNKVIKVTFSEPVKAGTNWIELKNSAGTVLPITISISGKVLTVKPNNLLVHGTDYNLVIHTGSLTDLAGNPIALCGFSFTVDDVPPRVTTSLPGGSYHTAPQSVTLTASDNVDPAPVIYYTTNATNPTTSSTKYTAPIIITNTTTLSFIAVDNAGNKCGTQVVNYIIDTRPYCVYTFQIPRYCNVTTDVNCPWISPVKSGFNGILKMGVSRIIHITTPAGGGYFVDGILVSPSSSIIKLHWGDSYYIPTTGDPCWPEQVNSPSDIQYPGVVISSSFDYHTISYYGILGSSVNQLSAVYRDGDEPEYETVDIILNGVKQVSVSFSVALPPYDDTNIKYELYYDNIYKVTGKFPPEDFLSWDIEQLCADGPPTMTYTNTGGSVYDSYLDINGIPFEYIKTNMSYGNTSISRTEKVTYGTSYAPSSSQNAGFEAIQSYAITNTKITDSIIQSWLNKKSQYPIGEMKASYGTFMTALTILWLSDKLADEMASCLNVTWNRNTYTTVMSGVTSKGAYVSCLDPAMGMAVNGNVDNVKFFRFVNSLMLSEVENGVLNSTGLQVNSTVSSIISGILDGKPFLFVLDEEANRLTLMLEGDEKYYIIIDLETGLVLDIVDENGSLYKGATSSNDAYCFHDGRTNNINNFVDKLVNDFIDGLKDPHTALSTAGGLLLLGACVASGPVGWLLLGTGIFLCAGGSGLFDDILGPNPGYKNPYNWLDFGTSLLLARFGAPGAKAAAGPIITNVGKKLAVSNVPIKGTLNPTRIAFHMQFGNYEIITSNQRIIRGVLGRTETEQVLTFSEEYLESTEISVIKDQAPPLPT